MLPGNDGLRGDFMVAEPPSRTFYIDPDKGTVSGSVDGIAAVVQAIYLILNTERYENLIYSWDYGVELYNLVGKPTSFVIPELRRRITEALLQDTRITAVDQFEFEALRGQVRCTFHVTTIFGETDFETAVMI